MRRRLDTELVRRGLVRSRARAVEAIEGGHVTVGGAPTRTASRQVDQNEPIDIGPPETRFVSRGGEKLNAALDYFDIDVKGLRALDAGASTGGFTDCLLQRGAEHVLAIDVGRGQIDWRLRNDSRVTVIERTNIRFLDSVEGGAVPILVADLSFISLKVVAPALAALSTPEATLVLLVKPQFEAGRARVPRGGVVRDPIVHRAVLDEVITGVAESGIFVTDVFESPLRGAEGNIEFLALARKDGILVSDERRHLVVAGAHA
ncbi:MAG: TlyA family RNA methyltransferase [Acidimicrobiia bacterium]|nr:TlyA family RNA methyltransferase [Acidimicrobiia bacterium]